MRAIKKDAIINKLQTRFVIAMILVLCVGVFAVSYFVFANNDGVTVNEGGVVNIYNGNTSGLGAYISSPTGVTDLNVTNDLVVDGLTTLTGDVGVTGDLAVTGTFTGKELNEAVAGTVTASTSILTIADSGTTFIISGSGTAFTLPAVATANGVNYRFVVGGAISTYASSTINSAAGDDIEGSLMVAGVIQDCNAADIITIGSEFENIGDFVEIMSNGTYWFVLSSNALTANELACSG